MNRSRGPKGRKPHGRDGDGQDRRASGRGSGNFRQKSFARGNAPIEKAEPARKAEPGLIRLNKYISNSGVCSRREADTYIAAGNVTVNGQTITEMGYQVRPGDEVRFDGRLLQAEKKEYILLNKPKNFITTTRDDRYLKKSTAGIATMSPKAVSMSASEMPAITTLSPAFPASPMP